MVQSITEYVSYFEAGEDMTDEEYGIYMRAIHNFAYKDIEPDYSTLTPLVKAALRTVIASVRKNKEDRENGAKGGRKTPVTEKVQGGYEKENNPPLEKSETNVNVNENVNANVNANVNVNSEVPGQKPHAPAQKTSRFSKPTLEEVQAYCLERQNNVNPERFMAHYQANGWLVGKTPMKDWKAAVRKWETTSSTPQYSPYGYGQTVPKALPPDRLSL